MKLLKYIAFISILIFTIPLFATEDGEKIFDAKCAICHAKNGPMYRRANMLAPPIIGVMRHIKMAYPKKEEAVNFIIDYVMNPTYQKALCPSIRRFGLMPSQKGKITPEELKKVANWLFDNFTFANFYIQNIDKNGSK